MLDPVRLHGTIQAPSDERRAFRRVQLVVDGVAKATIDEGEIEFALFEGGTVVIEVPAEGTELIAPIVTVERGAWSELRDRPEASRIARNLVTPFTKVELHVTTAPAGETVEVYGDAFEHEFDESTATLRDAPVRRPSRVLAKIIAFGRSDDAMSALRDAVSKLHVVRVQEEAEAAKPSAPEEKKTPRQPWAQWFPLVLLGSIALALGVVAQGSKGVVALHEELLALAFATFALVFRPTPDVPEFRSRAKLVSDARPNIMIVTRMVLGLVPLWLLYSLDNRPPLPSSYYPVGLLALMVGWFLSELLLNSDTHATLALLVDAPRFELSEAAGQTGTCEAKVKDHNAVRVAGRKAAMGVVTEWVYKGRNEGHKLHNATFTARPSFIVEHGKGRVAVDPNECVWATTVEDGRPEGSSIMDYSIAEWVPVNAPIAIYGRFVQKKKKELRLESIGTQPAIVFATDAPEGPLRVASRIVWKRRITLMVLAIGALGTIVLSARGTLL